MSAPVSNSAFNHWDFINSVKRSVHRALEQAKFNRSNRAGTIAAKAVLELIDGRGISLAALYDNSPGPYRRYYYDEALPVICTVRAKIGVFNNEREKITEFWIEKSWMKDPREKYMTPKERELYIENLVHAQAYLEAIHRQHSLKNSETEKPWPAEFGIAPLEIKELEENTRKEI